MIRVDSVEYEEGKLLLINSYYNEDAAAAAHSPVLRALAVSKQTNKANGYACASRRLTRLRPMCDGVVRAQAVC